MNTPEEIKHIIEDMSEIAVHGLLEEAGSSGYAVTQDGLRIACTPADGGGWVVAAGPADAGPTQFWSDIPDAKTKITIQLLETFIRPKDGDLRPIFRKVMHDVGTSARHSTRGSGPSSFTLGRTQLAPRL